MKKNYVIANFNLWSERFVVGNMAWLKPVFYESIKKGGGWVGVWVGFFLLGGLGLVSKINLVEGGIQIIYLN